MRDPGRQRAEAVEGEPFRGAWGWRRWRGGALLAAVLAGGCAEPDAAVFLSPEALAGREVYLSRSTPACGTCHRLSEAGTRGAIGPDLDGVRPSFERVLEVVRQGSGKMPAQAGVLTEQQIEAVTRYVVEATSGPARD